MIEPDCSCSVKNANSYISQGFKRLYSAKDIDRKKELRKLNHSVLVNFLDLIDILIKCPESPKRDEKIEDINLLFIHMHHLINEFRPHQARETLRVMLMVQRRKRTQFTSKFKEQLEKVESIIQEAIENLPEVDMEGLYNLYSMFYQILNVVLCRRDGHQRQQGCGGGRGQGGGGRGPGTLQQSGQDHVPDCGRVKL